MKVSVIIPAYNAEKYIKKCLDSIINQVYKNLEIIIIDDASTDSTKEIISMYAKNDNRIIPFYQSTNKGVSAARNVGLKAATGEYIVFVDSDDYLTKEAIRRMVDLSLKYNSDFIDNYHLLRYTNKKGKVLKFTEKKVPKNVLVMGNIKDNPKIITMATYVTGKLIKKSLFDGLEFDENLKCYEDMVLEHQIKPRIKNYVFMNRVVYIYEQRPTSLVNSLGKAHFDYIEAAKKVKNIYKNYSPSIKEEVSSMLISNMFLTCITKVVKNDGTVKENTILAKEYLNKLIKLFPKYNENKKVNKLIRKYIYKFTNDDKKLEKFILRTKNINFINIYFRFMSITNKYEIKNRLE